MHHRMVRWRVVYKGVNAELAKRKHSTSGLSHQQLTEADPKTQGGKQLAQEHRAERPE